MNILLSAEVFDELFESLCCNLLALLQVGRNLSIPLNAVRNDIFVGKIVCVRESDDSRVRNQLKHFAVIGGIRYSRLDGAFIEHGKHIVVVGAAQSFMEINENSSVFILQQAKNFVNTNSRQKQKETVPKYSLFCV